MNDNCWWNMRVVRVCRRTLIVTLITLFHAFVVDRYMDVNADDNEDEDY
jgi:hypothetical protein